MRDAVVGTIEGVAREWRDEAERRRVLSKTDPVADTLAFCASELSARIRTVSVAEREGVAAERYAASNGVSPQTVRLWCRRGLVPARKIGSGWMIRSDAPRPAREKRSA